MQTFIRVTEIWLPSRDRSRLEFGDGLYGPLGEFRDVSERTAFACDEGLPGKAWAARHPIILKDLQTSYFRRGEAAKAAGLTCAVALPVMAGDILLAVMVFLCGDDAEHVGAIELWHNNAAANAEMGLVDGYYGTADAFPAGPARRARWRASDRVPLIEPRNERGVREHLVRRRWGAFRKSN